MELFERVNAEIGSKYKSNKTIRWYNISQSYNLSEDFIEEFKDKLDGSYISSYQVLSESFIERNSDFVNWDIIAEKQKLSEEFIEKHIDKIDMDIISHSQKLSMGFIEKHANKLDWCQISMYHDLSEEMIDKYCDFVDWSCISKYQRLTEGFISKHENDVDWFYISKHQKLSEDFKNDYRSKLYFQIMNDNWIYKSADEKKDIIKHSNLFKCYDDYFIAYKAIRPDRYSLFNFKYKYEKDNVYEEWCDCSENGCSFGLNVSTMDYAKNIGKLLRNNNFLVVRCKVRYEDVGRLQIHFGSARSFKITIID